MMVKPHQHVYILAILVAVPASLSGAEIADGMSSLLSDQDFISDWRYRLDEIVYEVQADSNPQEGSIFCSKLIRSLTLRELIAGG